MLIRAATRADAPAMAELLNQIIAIGGTTAHEQPLTPADIVAHYLAEPDYRSGVVAEDGGQIIGWQTVAMWLGDPHIGTFVRPGIQARGVGMAMFAMTCDLCRAAGVAEIVAFIRADNVPGLAFYARAGFVDFGHDPGFALRDGTVVGRVHRKFALA